MNIDVTKLKVVIEGHETWLVPVLGMKASVGDPAATIMLKQQVMISNADPHVSGFWTHFHCSLEYLIGKFDAVFISRSDSPCEFQDVLDLAVDHALQEYPELRIPIERHRLEQ